MAQPISRSPFKIAIADCETIAFPRSPHMGCTCFRVDQGKLYQWLGDEWKQIHIPRGKLWFNPSTKKLCVWSGTQWHVHGED